MAERRKGKKPAAKKPAAKNEAKAHEPSSVDAMGQDKRREVVGHSYGPSRKSQAVFFIIVGVIALVLVGGSLAAVSAFDQPEDEYPDEAPWAQAEGANNPAPNSPGSPCGEPGNPPQFEKGTACAAERTSDDGPALPGEVPPGTAEANPDDSGSAK